MSSAYMCPACGYPELTEPPYTSGGGGSYEICYSCGFEFGVTDDDRGYTFASWRAEWIAKGMPWDSEGIDPMPDGWDPERQLQNLIEPPPVDK